MCSTVDKGSVYGPLLSVLDLLETQLDQIIEYFQKLFRQIISSKSKIISITNFNSFNILFYCVINYLWFAFDKRITYQKYTSLVQLTILCKFSTLLARGKMNINFIRRQLRILLNSLSTGIVFLAFRKLTLYLFVKISIKIFLSIKGASKIASRC